MDESYTVLLSVNRGDYVATVIATADGFVLNWHDGLVNSWSEAFPTFATALARLAVLDHCVVQELGFATEPAEFVGEAGAFLDAQTDFVRV